MRNVQERDVAVPRPVASEADIACLQFLGLSPCQTEPLRPSISIVAELDETLAAQSRRALTGVGTGTGAKVGTVQVAVPIGARLHRRWQLWLAYGV